MKASGASLIVIGLGLMLSASNCPNQNLCASSAAAAGSGGSGGSSNCSTASGGSAGTGVTTCGQLTALDACFSAFCQANGVGTPFCTCFSRGYDLDAAPKCGCVAVNPAAFCQQAEANGLDGSNLDCSAATSAVATQCVGVQ